MQFSGTKKDSLEISLVGTREEMNLTGACIPREMFLKIERNSGIGI
jgi:hypothetical protein